ncbi:replication initiation protein [Halonatronum saccharophilum]|uniref:replication initiation protein n=1 Tax=Halonatronum saccharophilum TaxID=150060 RepID=UPI0004AFE2AB|nr:replication initiation protein [Halonatronum saccharophilum]
MGNNLIVKHNEVIESKYNMTSTEAKIVAKLACMINMDDEEFKEHKFRSKDLLDELGLGETNYAALRESIERLITRKIEINQSDKKRLVTTFLSSCVYNNKNSTITLSYDPKLKPYFLQLKNNFTKYYLENILELKSFYSIRIYELLKQYERIRERTLGLEELKKMLGAENKSYNRYNNFKRKVLLQAQEEINQKTDLKMSFEEVKTGRKVTGIKFLIDKKEVVKEKVESFGYDEKKYSKEVLDLFDLLPHQEQVEAHKRELKALLDNHSFEYIKGDIEYAKGAKPDNFFGFLKSSCESGHYAAAKLEKKEKERELARKKAEEEKLKKQIKDNIEKKSKEKAVKMYNDLSKEELDKYDDEYDRMARFVPENIRPSRKEYIVGSLQDEIREELEELLFN